jgi:Ca2+-transporting ATPase
MRSPAWEKLTAEETIIRFESDARRGLSDEEIEARQRRYGRNKLEEQKDATLLQKFFRQFKSPLVSILLVAGLVTLVLAEYLDAAVIFAALFINVVVGMFQEERASRAFEKLNKSQEYSATVIRDGRKKIVSVEELVPGDIVDIESGQYVPADLRIISEKHLLINEAALTGEWVAVSKNPEALTGNVPLAERRNMAWRGTLVAEGYGLGVVIATGDKTQVGIIAKELGTIEEHITPLQQNIRTIARFLSYAIGIAILIIFILGIIRGESLGEMLLISIAVAVATIPSGLPAAVTVVLALGMEAILARGGLVRNLLAAETLGSTTIILTDKTGTLTEAKMKLAKVYTLETLRRKRDVLGPSNDEKEALKGAVLASDAFVEEHVEADERSQKEIIVHGRPIERAVVSAGLDLGITKQGLFSEYEEVDYLQFESKRRFGGSLNASARNKKQFFYITGAPETLLAESTHMYVDGKRERMTSAIRTRFEELQRQESENGLRFIGVACKEVSWKKIPDAGTAEEEQTLIEKNTFLGFLSFEDPIRGDVAQAIREVKGAGAEVLMVTGDNPETARKVACDVGISCDVDRVKTGADIDAAKDDDALYALIRKTKIFARTLPTQKLRIVRLLKNRREVVAMTGDGVNDAPALRSANIGVAVGSGTEVAKEASDIILLNNSFSIIVAAIEEGRRIIDNLRKIIAYLLSTSFSEIFVIGGALAVGAPLPLLPAQILWANIIEEGLMSFAFAFEKADPNAMKRNPRESSSKAVMTPGLQKLIVIVSAVTGVFLIALYFFLHMLNLPIEEIRTIMFVALSLDAIFFAFSLKSLERPVWRIDLASNVFLLIAFGLSVSLLFAAITLAPLQTLLSLTPLTELEMLLLVGVGLFNLLTIEGAKYFFFERGLRK